MRYSDEILNKIMPLLEKKMEGFRARWSGFEVPGVYDEDKFRKYIHSVGGSLVMEDFYPENDDDMDDGEWDRLCDHHSIKMEERTGMFPVLLPHRCGRYVGCLLPHELVSKILALGFFP